MVNSWSAEVIPAKLDVISIVSMLSKFPEHFGCLGPSAMYRFQHRILSILPDITVYHFFAIR